MATLASPCSKILGSRGIGGTQKDEIKLVFSFRGVNYGFLYHLQGVHEK